MKNKYIITVSIDAPDGIDTTGLNAWDFFPALDPKAEYETREQAESEAFLAYLGTDDDGVGAIATVERI
jgi:hypothetical protein